jgi:tRNA modification GTPase
MEDTIAAISTPVGEGGIAIIRVSGSSALQVADTVFASRRGKASSFPTHTVHFGVIRDGSETLDQVMLTVMRGPRTYSGEDTVEINCHGGLLAARRVLALCLRRGCRLAEPGEFTKRAFLNGRMDLVKAESVIDVIRAKTERSHAAAVRLLEGALSRRVNALREEIVTIIAHVEAHIDFPEEDITPDTRYQLAAKLDRLLDEMRRLSATSREGKILRGGITVAIVGRPNVGKSSLLNALLGQERAIVTPIAGTTRDTIEEFVDIGGIPISITDTAGIRKTPRKIESEGVKRSHKALMQSQIVIHVIDCSRAFSRVDSEIHSSCAGKKTIVVLSKADKPGRLRLPRSMSGCVVRTSVISGEGLANLKELIGRHAGSGELGSVEADVTVNERHADALIRSEKALTRAHDELAGGSLLEGVAQELRSCLDSIGEIVGKTTTDDILDRIFSQFCIGK